MVCTLPLVCLFAGWKVLGQWGAADAAQDGGLQWQCTAFWLLCTDIHLESGWLHHQQRLLRCASSRSLQRCERRVSLPG